MPDESNEKKLIDDAQKGDIKTFERLVFAYEKKIYRYIYNLVGQKQDAEDLTQETFVRVYKNRCAIKPEENLGGWLYRIATNITYDWFRKKKIRPELLIIDDPENRFETIDEEFTYNKIETKKDLERALSKIGITYRAVLALFYWQGLKYEEIASVLSVPVNTVKTHLRRAKQALKMALEGNN